MLTQVPGTLTSLVLRTVSFFVMDFLTMYGTPQSFIMHRSRRHQNGQKKGRVRWTTIKTSTVRGSPTLR